MVTEILANFIAETRYEQLPPEVTTAAKRALLDFFGVALAGASAEGSRLITEYVKEEGGNPEASVIAAGFKTSPSLAALANGTIAHALDYDDCFNGFPIHPSVAIMPAVLALAEKTGASGKKVIEAYAVGFEIACKVGSVVGLRQRELGWHNTATLGCLGAAAAASRLLDLTAGDVRMALGIAASLAGGLRQNFGTMTKPLHAGNAARNGVLAASLAGKSFTSYDGVLEAPLGFFKVLGMPKGRDLSEITEHLGSPYSVASPGILFKLFPSCHGTHRGIDAALRLRRETGVRTEDIVDIECRTTATVPTSLFHHRPKTPTEARFSMEYCVARALVDGQMGLAQFDEEKIQSPDVRDLVQKVHYSHPDDIGQGVDQPQEVVLRLRDGRTCSRKGDVIKGDPENPISWEELCLKYRDCAGRFLPAPEVDRLLELVSNLETLDDITRCIQVAAQPRQE